MVASIDELVRKPSPIGALLLSQPDPTMHNDAGVGTNGGIFAAINGTLVWALALVNGSMAWDEWKKNSLARHAEAYPDMWYGIWSGPDAYHSVLSKDPGHTEPDFPVMNMHAHAWPLYSAAKLLGLEFHENGINFRPDLPLPSTNLLRRCWDSGNLWRAILAGTRRRRPDVGILILCFPTLVGHDCDKSRVNGVTRVLRANEQNNSLQR